MFKILFGTKTNPFINNNEGRPQIAFYKEAAFIGEHGRLVVNSPKYGLSETNIAFAFVGVSIPPILSLNTIRYIWDEAQVQGYIPLEITAYYNFKNIETIA